MPGEPSETDSLLPSGSSSRAAGSSSDRHGQRRRDRLRRHRSSVLAVALFSIVVFILTWGIVFRGFQKPFGRGLPPASLPKDPLERAKALLDRSPLVDGHVDIAVQARYKYRNQLDKIDLDDADFPLHVNIPRLKRGKLGGLFWSAYTPCPSDLHEWQKDELDYTKASWSVRDTLEQIDIVKLLVRKYKDTFELVTSAEGIQGAFDNGKVASLIGLEGAHQLGNSLSTLRQYYELGVRYITLSHTCNNAFAGSSGMDGKPIDKQGLSPFGIRLVHEMNRLGMIVDVSHTSDLTVSDVLKHAHAPFIFSHSNARAVYDSVRNIPDDLLKAVGKTSSDKRALVMATFAPQFVGVNATLSQVADHIEYIAKFVGRNHVGIGSDFDGILSTPAGLENASKYPDLLAELIRRGWKDREITDLTGGNLIRTFKKVEAFAKKKRHAPADTTIYSKRKDL
ncbi:hypothetical protein P389DRAFT_48660 [Cystobasidium minutum MCA 4210]|uniref:uncharacterized protein n=1 Tax=Cystobasidium minutum MCA 4210 TaxID=1397322 RepID=UPI0034CEF5CC|eukprot:jgi/Rhomi1/48660/CE48659_1673